MGNAFREALDLIVELLQFQVEQFAPYDPRLDGFAQGRITARRTLLVETFQISCGLAEPFVQHGSLHVFHLAPPRGLAICRCTPMTEDPFPDSALNPVK